MIVVGSRCGGFDFYVKKEKSDDVYWIGPNENSDFDCFSDNYIKSGKIYVERFGNVKKFYERFEDGHHIYAGHKFPYSINQDVCMPEDKTYLSFAIRRKIRKEACSPFHVGTRYEIYDKQGIYVTNIEYKFII